MRISARALTQSGQHVCVSYTSLFLSLDVQDSSQSLTLGERLRTHKVCKIYKIMIVILPLLPKVHLKSYVVGIYSNRYPQHMILETLKNITFYHFNINLRFPLFYYKLGGNLG